MSETKKVRVGVIGCGAIAEHAHLAGYSLIPDQVEIVALADPLQERLDAMAAKYNVSNLYRDYNELLARPDIDAVSICTPNYLHAPLAIAAARAGKHVLGEKPMALTLEEADQMAKAAQEAGVILMIGFTHRYYNFNQKAQQMVKDGSIGKPYVIRVRFAHDGPYNSWSAKTDWFFNPVQAGGGALLDMGIHAIDICSYYLGEIKSVSAEMATLGKPIQVEDTAILTLTFANGAVGYIEVGWSSQAGPLGLEIFGSEGTLVVDYSTPIRLYSKKTGEWSQPEGLSGGGWDAEMAHFIDCVRTGKRPLTTEVEGKQALRVALAAYESSKKGCKVAL